MIETAEIMAAEKPDRHNKTLFIMTALYSMYLRISELAASARWTPRMCHFYRDQDGLMWFTVVGKGNKQRQIAVSDAMQQALRVYRESLNLTPLPARTDESPLLPKSRGKGPITSTSYLRKIVQVVLIVPSKDCNRMVLPKKRMHWLKPPSTVASYRHFRRCSAAATRTCAR